MPKCGCCEPAKSFKLCKDERLCRLDAHDAHFGEVTATSLTATTVDATTINAITANLETVNAGDITTNTLTAIAGITGDGLTITNDGFFGGNLVVTLQTTTGTLNIANIPTSNVGLVSGDVWSNLGVLTIVP